MISIMGEKDIMVSTPFPTEYIEEDEEAMETSFQALEIVGTTNIKIGRGDIKPSKVVIMVAKVLITNGFKPGKGLRRRLDGMANSVAIQENPGRAGLGYSGAARKAKLRGIVTPGHVATIEDQPMELVEWVYSMAQELENWTVEAQDEEEETEEEALRELERLLEQERPMLQSGIEELETINLNKGEETREIRIGKLIPPDFKQRLTKLLREYEDIFAWSYRDMPRLDTTIVEHRLPLVSNAILNETESGLKNKKRNGKTVEVRLPDSSRIPLMGGQYRANPQEGWESANVDLNRESLKHNFPLSHIDLLVDNTAQHSCYSFMDGFSGYNQIRMALEDKEKTTFITTWGTFYYKVMPFRLKNVRATY
ncbi:hypothetical protein CR513_37865, partial [Mucuna pruriens]